MTNATPESPRGFGPYSVIGVIGRGAYGVVVKVVDPFGDIYAAKIVKRAFLQRTNSFFAFEQELRVHQSLDHPHIVKIREILYEPENIYVVMEFCERGDLFGYMSQEGLLSLGAVRSIFFQILLAVRYLHNRNIAHLDLKPDNILITADGVAKISDFGFVEAPPKRQNNAMGPIGTLYYAAPEIIERRFDSNLPADIWSLGILLFAMTAECLPWLPGSDAEVARQIMAGEMMIPEDLPTSIYKIVTRCCVVDREKRPKIDDLINDPIFEVERKKFEKQQKVTFNHNQAVLPSLSFSGSKANVGKLVFSSQSMRSFAPKKHLILRPNESRDMVMVNGAHSITRLSLNKVPNTASPTKINTKRIFKESTLLV